MKRRLILILVLLLMQVTLVHAQLTATVKLSPSFPLPGDHVRGTLTISTTSAETISSISFMTSLPVTPKEVSGIGAIPADSAYTLPFTLTAPAPGVYTVKVYIFTTNGTLVKTFNINVVKSEPEVVITTPIRLDEVNDVHFTLYNPIDAVDVKVIPLFKAYPSTIYADKGGSFVFYPTNETPLRFKIEFYDGFPDNFHSYVQTVYPEFVKSRGVSLNVSTPHTSYYLCDVIPVSVGVSNLRGDTIYSVRVELKSGGYEKSVVIPFIKPDSLKKVTINCPALKPGKQDIEVVVSFRDSLNNSYRVVRNVVVSVKPEKAVSISDMSLEKSGNGFEISGDVDNNGWSRVYSVTVTAVGKKNKSYFIGTIDPSDYDTFDIVTQNATKIVVTWQNELGESFSASKPVHIGYEKRAVETSGNGSATLVAFAGALLVLIIVAVSVYLSWKRRR